MWQKKMEGYSIHRYRTHGILYYSRTVAQGGPSKIVKVVRYDGKNVDRSNNENETKLFLY